MTTTHTSSSQVCIRKENADLVGTGFLVDEQHILTCAHVVAEALEWSRGEFSPDPPQELVHLDFPLLDHNTMLTARVVFWQPAREDWSGGDIAGLQLMSDAPVGAEAVRFALAEDVWDHDFRAFGFPGGQDNGVWATGRLLDRQASNWIQIEDNKTGGFAVIPGFSGGAVWDEQLGGVVGMVVAAIVRPETKVAFVIPQDVLFASWSLIKPATRQRVFLSAAPADAAHAARLRADLEASGILVWDEQHGPAGRSAVPERVRQQAIRAALALVVIVSTQTLSSLLVREHLRLADLYQRRRIFVWMGDQERRPEQRGWSDLIWVDAHGPNYATALQMIGATLSERPSITGLLDALNEPAWEPRNPYVGLRPFTAHETKDFFGRELFVEHLRSEIQERLKGEPRTKELSGLLTIIGASGSGKSSVVLAGLLPLLRQREESKTWVYLNPMVPGKDPIAALVDTLSPHFPDTSFKTQRENLEGDTTNGLHRLAKQLATRQELITRQKARVVLFVDQFEELFTPMISEDHRRRFLDLLRSAVVEPEGPLLVLLTLRADFYHHLMEYSAFYKLIEPTLNPLLPLELEELRATIERPAAQPDVQLFFEGNLIGDLLFEVQGQAGALPLLQFTLQQLFERRNGHRLTQQAYKDIGKVSGALAQYAEETYEQLTREQQPLARGLFLRLLEPGATEQDTTRRRAERTEFVFDDSRQTRLMQETIDVFVKARLLTTNSNESAGTTTIEVSHEALIREWPLLVSWLREARDDIPLQQAVSKDVEEWEQHGKPKDRLYRGTQLKEAKTWTTHYMVSEREMAFLRAGERQRRLFFFKVIAGALLLLLLGIPTWQLGLHVWQTLQSHVVNNLNSDGTGSLQDVVSNAIDGSTITFRPGLKGTITLSHNLTLDKRLILHGPGTGDIVISSGNNNQNHQISVSGQSVLIDGLGFENSVLGTNFIHNTGDLTLAHSIISGVNVSNDLINNENGTLTITNSTISGNNIVAPSGSIIYDNGTHSKLFIKESQILKNYGCNIYNDPSNTVIVESSTIYDNMNCGGFYNKGHLTIRNSTISGNGNTANLNGGGITNELGGTLTITNSTISGNMAGESGGGIANLSGTTLLSFCTIYGNKARAGGGIVVLAGTVTLSKSIVAGNTLVPGEHPFHQPIEGTFLSQGFNLIQNMTNIVPRRAFTPDTSNIAISHFTPVHDRPVSASDLTKIIDPQGLQNNGGPTETYLLLPRSDNPAIDAIPQDACVDAQGHRVITDQRNMPRPDKNEKVGQRCDIGAYESSD